MNEAFLPGCGAGAGWCCSKIPVKRGTAVAFRCHYLSRDRWEQNVNGIATACILPTSDMAYIQDRCFSHLSYNCTKLQKTSSILVHPQTQKHTPNHITVTKKTSLLGWFDGSTHVFIQFWAVRKFTATLDILRVKPLNLCFSHHSHHCMSQLSAPDFASW